MNSSYSKTSYKFTNPYSFAHHIVHGEVEHYQLVPGDFYGELNQIVSNKVIISTHKMNLPLLQIGIPKKDFTTFLLPGNMLRDFSWRNDSLSGERIGILKSYMPHIALTPPNFFGTPVSLSNDYFNEIILKNGYDESIYQLIQQADAININPSDAYKAQQMIISLCNSKTINYELMTIDLPEFILKSIEERVEIFQKEKFNTHFASLGKALTYIHKHLDQKSSPSEIYSSVEISERSLRYIFIKLIGLSPMKYIKTIKLNKVRKDIIKSKGDTNIKSIANKWGFSHSGQFAKDYKILFDEYPSDTARSHN